MAGYSGTPLAKKLGIKDDFRAALLHVPDEVKAELREALGKCRIQPIAGRRPRFHFPLCRIARGARTRTVACRKGTGPCGHAVDLVAEDKFRRPDRSHGKCDSPERAGCWPGGRESLRGHRRLVGIEVRDPGQESTEEISVETAALGCPGERSSPAVSVVILSCLSFYSISVAGLCPAGQPRAAVPTFRYPEEEFSQYSPRNLGPGSGFTCSRRGFRAARRRGSRGERK